MRWLVEITGKTKRWLVLLLSFNLFVTAHSQFKLSGYIADTEGYKLPDAIMYILYNDSLKGMINTDKNGSYSISELEKGNYNLIVECKGYNDHREHILIENNTTRNILLWKEMQGTLEAVAIIADRSNVVGQTHSGSVFHLSATARNSKTLADALKEIPQLSIDDSNNSIKLNDGSNPLILINGMRRGEAAATIDPQDILSVEIIESASAKYMAEGFTGIINIRLKKKTEYYQQANLTTQHDAGLSYGFSNGGYELGGANYSFFLSGRQFYFNRNHATNRDIQQTLSSLKEITSESVSNYLHYGGTLGGDFVLSKRDYLSYSSTFTYIPSNLKGSGEGNYQQNGERKNYDYNQYSSLRSFVSSSSILFQHTFADKSSLEVLGGFTVNHNKDRYGNEETGDEIFFRNNTKYQINNNRGKVSVDYTLKLLGHETSIGNNFSFEKNNITNTGQPVFYHKNWNDYLYIDMSNSLKNGFSYMASLGMNLIYNKAADLNHYYTFFSPAFSANYKYKNHSWRVNFNRSGNVPGVGYMNPYNTSSDSLYYIVGNPYLKAYPVSRISLSYTFSKRMIYLQPQLQYLITNRAIDEVGYYDEDIYIRTFENSDKNKLFIAGINSRLNFKNGFIGVNLSYHNHQFYTGTYNMFKSRLNWRATYKKFTFNGHIDYTPTIYTATTKEKSTSESLATLTWDINDKWGVNLGMRYFLERKEIQRWTYGENYTRYFFRSFDERNNMVMIGAKFKWSHKNQYNTRNKRKLNTDDGTIQLIK